MKPTQQEMGERLSMFIDEVQIKTAEIAEKAGFSENYIRMMKRGERDPINSTLLYILHTKGCNLNWLVSGDGNMLVTDEHPLVDDVRQFYKSFNNIIEELRK